MSAVIPRTFFEDVFKDLPSGYFIRPLHGDSLPKAEQLRIDVQESGPDFIVHADLPGVRRDDIQVNIDGNQVSVSAEVRQEDRKIEDGKVLHAERYVGSVSRTFKLPVDIDQGAAKARYQDGVLTLTLPKASVRSSRLVIE
jgi:HSP20 family protein